VSPAGNPPPVGSDDARLRLAAIVDSSDDAIVSKTLEGIIVTWNRAAETMFGYTASEAVGKSITMIIPPERLHEETEVLTRVRRGDRVEHFETIRVHKNGTRVYISLTVSPIRNDEGVIVGASKIARDIGERIRAEEQRELLLSREQDARTEAEKANRIKDEFLATLSHELRTPLNAMLGWTRLLRAGALDAATGARAVETIERNTRVLIQLVEDVLDVARITTGTMRLEARPVALVPVIEAAIESMRPAARAKRISVGLFLDSAVPPVNGDAARLQQIVWNLVSNAIKFTDADGRVEVHLSQDHSQAEIRVVDTGHGIDPAFLPRVFDRFTQADSSTTRAHAGLGLGLAIVRHLVELHGGVVRASSEGIGRGSTFSIDLPIPGIRREAEIALGRTIATADLRGLRIVVLDDDRDARELIAAVLTANGAEPILADSVEAGLTAMDRGRPDLVVCDIAMPERNGYDFVRAMRHRGLAHIPVAALTALVRDEDRRRVLDAGFVAHIGKPVDPGDLVRELARLTGRV
jgi:PAS domain S-box-containing protein